MPQGQNTKINQDSGVFIVLCPALVFEHLDPVGMILFVLQAGQEKPRDAGLQLETTGMVQRVRMNVINRWALQKAWPKALKL